MPEESIKNGKDYLNPRLDNYLREYELRLGGYLTGEEDGITIGHQEEKNKITMGLINQNVGYEVISKATGLSISEIEELAKNYKDKN